MKIMLVSLTFITPVGLNETRKTKLIEGLKEDYPMQGSIDPGGFFALFRGSMADRIVLGNNDFTFANEGDDIKLDFDKAKQILFKLYDILSLDPPSAGICRLVGIEETNIDTMSFSLTTYLSENVKKALQEFEPAGVGLRLFLNKDGLWWDFKVEPKLSNRNQLFLELTANLPKMDLATMIQKMRGIYKEFGHNYITILRKAGFVPEG